MNTTNNELHPDLRVYHRSRGATVPAVDADPEAHVWIVFVEDPDENALVHRDQISAACEVCERAPASVDAIDDDK